MERTAVLATGGRVVFRFCPTTLGYYFLGTASNTDDLEVVNLLVRVLRKGDVFFDIGTYIGVLSFLAAPLCGREGRIHAFEANPQLSENLGRSAAANRDWDNVVLNLAAVGPDHGGEVDLFFPAEDEPISGIPSTLLHSNLDPGQKASVPQVSIDGYVATHGSTHIDVLKIDIEGGEMRAFSGMEQTFRDLPPGIIICELMPRVLHVSGGKIVQTASEAATPLELKGFLEERGYEAFHIRVADGRLDRPITAQDLQNLSFIINVAFVRPEIREAHPDMFAGGH